MQKNNATSFEKKVALQKLLSDFKGTDQNSQCNRLLAALACFPVTTFEAMRFLDVYHAPARVLQLRKLGHRITTHWQTVVTEAGEKHRVGLYVKEGLQ